MSHLKPNMLNVIIFSVIIVNHFLKDCRLQGVAKGQAFGSMTLAIMILSITTLSVTIKSDTKHNATRF
jgi:hypothetical protein